MTINLHLPQHNTLVRPTITVVGVGGAGGNAVNNMIHARLEGVHFVIANTDSQALESAQTERTIQLGASITKGLGAGADPEMGRAAAEEAMEEIGSQVQGSNMVFITAGMGGGTGTGAAPVVARLSRELGILTVAVVTKPFQFEGGNRMRIADEGIKELQKYVDTLIVIPNQNLFRIATERTTFADAFRMADEVLHSGVRGVTDLMVKPGLVNLDFADIRTVMREMGKAMMGTGEATGEKRAVEAAEAAISNPLLDDVSLKGARAALINITGGSDMTLFEVDEAANRIREEIDPDANIIFGSAFNEELEGRIRVSVVATGIDAESAALKDIESSPKTVPLRRPFSYAPAAIAAGSGNTHVAGGVKREPTAVQQPAAPRQEAPRVREEVPVTAMQPSAIPVQSQPVQQSPALMEEQPVYKQPMQEAPVEPVAAAPALYAAPDEGYAEAPQDAGPLFSPKSAGRTQAPALPAQMEEDEEDEDDSSRGMPSFGFLNRIKEAGKVLTTRNDAPAEQPQVRTRSVEVAERRRVAEPVEQPEAQGADDMLEIPAFLRRQAN